MSAIQDFFEDKCKLPSPPAIALKILTAVQEEEYSFEDLAQIVTQDPALTARILKVANSSLYGLAKSVDSLTQATSLIGTNSLTNLALSFVIVNNYRDGSSANFDLEYFWRRSVTTGVAAQMLAQATHRTDQHFFVAGLLLEIGVLVLALHDPDLLDELLETRRAEGKLLVEIETARLGFSHADLGAYLLNSWNIPDSIVKPIEAHHSADQDKDTRLLAISEKISAIYHGRDRTKHSAEVHTLLSAEFGLSDAAVDSLIDEIGERARDVLDAFSLDPGNMKPFTQIIQEANDELRRLNLSYEEVLFELQQAKQEAEQLARELHTANQRLRKLAFHDELTGLHNHRFFQETLETELHRAMRYRQSISLLMVDIDYFKNINDTYGHLVGDHVLREISAAMSHEVRQCDIVARYGGDEFAVILPSTGGRGAINLAKRLHQRLSGLEIKHPTAHDSLSVTVSIGLSSASPDEEQLSRQTLINQSDIALYRAKEKGRNQIESMDVLTPRGGFATNGTFTSTP